MSIIYHITSSADWESTLSAGWYAADSLRNEGFIHCSTAAQVLATANRLFRGRTNLVLLGIETDRVQADIRHENLEGGSDLFPHVYGAIETGSIVAAYALEPQADGRFDLPAALKADAG